ncbi:MAG: hypothetical protein JKY56_15865 [Kofleriaceae bacterium]|nr:hypothetical protein [Kofleriaceae bacterium]
MTDKGIQIVPLREESLAAPSRQFFLALMRWRPEWRQHCRMQESDNGTESDLVVEIPSPTGDSGRNINVWVSNGDLSLSFGPWHTHGQLILELCDGHYEEVGLLDAIRMIVENQLVCFHEELESGLGGGLLDLRKPDAILEEITDKYSTGRISVRSWDGQADQNVDVTSD